jgi:glycosyltransferase involved in cell wall biosynthesis
MKVLQVSTADRGGGAEAVALGLHRSLRARGVEASLAVGWRRTAEEGVVEIGGARSRRGRVLHDPRVALDLVRGREDFRFPASHRLLGLAAEADVLHLHNLHGGYFDLTLLPALSSRPATVVTLHDEWLYTGHCAYTLDSERWLTGCGRCPHLDSYPRLLVDGTAENWRRKRALYERSRLHLVAPSRWLLERVERSMLAPAALSTRVIPNGVDLDVFHPGPRNEARARLGVGTDAHVIVFAAQGARTNPYKDFATLREALARLGSSAGTRIDAFALGEAAPDERLGRVTLRSIGSVGPAAVADHLRAADIYVLPTKADNHPLTVIEALACGCPVVASRVGGIPEQLTEATGALVRPGDPADLAAATEGLLADPDRRAAMGAAAADDARARFSLPRQVDAYVELYDEIAERVRDSPGVGGG